MDTEKFEQRVRDGYYQCSLPYGKKGTTERAAYAALDLQLTKEWHADFEEYIEQELGVPRRYAAKVAERAWEDGHAYGHSEVLGRAHALAEIFAEGS